MKAIWEAMDATRGEDIQEQGVPPLADIAPSEVAMNRLCASLERAYPNTGLLLTRSFMTGVATALGATVGLAVLLWLIGWALNGLGYFDPLKPMISAIQRFVQTPSSSPTPRR